MNVAEALTGFAHDAWIASVLVEVRRDVLPELLEDESAAGEVEGREVGASDRLTDNLLGNTGNELDHTRRHTSFFKHLVHEVVGVRRHGRGLPDDGVADQRRCFEW